MNAGGNMMLQPETPRGYQQYQNVQLPTRGPYVFRFRPNQPNRQDGSDNQSVTYDGKRIRKAIYRKTIDYNTAAVNYVENRIWQRDHRDHRAIATDPLYAPLAMPPPSMPKTAMNCVTSKFIRTSTNKIKCPIFCVCWTPEGRRLVTGASSGEFTLWNGLTFNFETILQAHDSSVRAMVWSHNDQWMLTADHGGFVKYWQSNMNNVKMYQAHKDPIRGLSFCPLDTKYTSCSDDGTVRIWDFLRCHEERILRGHGADVKCVDWHPQKALVVSGSKDTQQPVKLWDPRTGNSLATLHAHKHTVMEVKWNNNGNWLLTASRDHLVKLFDIRNLKEEMQTFKGHKKEATTVAWHPIHESLFASGGSDGGIMFWLVGHDKEVGSIDEAHEMMVWSLAWHPMGHILCSGSNDHTTKFWSRNRPGDMMRDRYNLNNMPLGTSEDMLEYDNDLNTNVIPGMGLEYGLPEHLKPADTGEKTQMGAIPGLDEGDDLKHDDRNQMRKKVPYAKPVPRNFKAAWESGIPPEQAEAEAAAQGMQNNANDMHGFGNPQEGVPGPRGPLLRPENLGQHGNMQAPMFMGPGNQMRPGGPLQMRPPGMQMRHERPGGPMGQNMPNNMNQQPPGQFRPRGPFPGGPREGQPNQMTLGPRPPLQRPPLLGHRPPGPMNGQQHAARPPLLQTPQGGSHPGGNPRMHSHQAIMNHGNQFVQGQPPPHNQFQNNQPRPKNPAGFGDFRNKNVENEWENPQGSNNFNSQDQPPFMRQNHNNFQRDFPGDNMNPGGWNQNRDPSHHNPEMGNQHMNDGSWGEPEPHGPPPPKMMHSDDFNPEGGGWGGRGGRGGMRGSPMRGGRGWGGRSRGRGGRGR